MDHPYDKNADQIAGWNGRHGARWSELQEHLDTQFAPVTAALFDAAAIRPGERVLDIGCGAGQTSLLAAERAGAGGHVLGADVSAPMLARARERVPSGAPVAFVEADATTYSFPPADADLLLSRFGVMFFAEPALAFANIRNGLKPGGRLAFACWRDRSLNPYFTLPIKAVLTVAPPPAEQPPDAPGPFSFAAEARLREVLGVAGFEDIALRPVDLEIDCAAGGGLDAAVRWALDIGPASRLLIEQPPAIQRAALAAIRTALARHQRGDAVPLAAAIWIVTARNPG